MPSDSEEKKSPIIITWVLLGALMLAVFWPIQQRRLQVRRPPPHYVNADTNVLRVYMNGIPLDGDNVFLTPVTNRLELRTIVENLTTALVESAWVSIKLSNGITNTVAASGWSPMKPIDPTATQFFPQPAAAVLEPGKPRVTQPFILNTEGFGAIGATVLAGAGQEVGQTSRIHFFFGTNTTPTWYRGLHAENFLRELMGTQYNSTAVLSLKPKRSPF